MVEKSYLATVHRIATICSDPNIAIHTSLSRFLGNLRLFGRDPAEVISEIALLCYFPTTTRKDPPSDMDTIHYAYSSTRPTLNQLRPFQTRPFRLIPIIPMAPLKSLQAYLNPTALSQFTTCPSRCDVYTSYYCFFDIALHHPIIPCMMHRCIYAIFEPQHLTVYLGQTGATARTLNQLAHNDRFLKHRALARYPDLSWQILQLRSSHFTTSSRTSTEPETRMMVKLQKNHPTVTFTQDIDFFYRSFTSSAPRSCEHRELLHP